MNLVVERTMNHMKLRKENWSQLEVMKMQLGFQVLFHNFFMITCILILAKVLGIFSDSVILLISYGMLKLTAGGIHFEKSSICLMSTSAFIIFGVVISRHLEISFCAVLLIYVVCMIVLWIIGPQGTENNPISKNNYDKLRRKTVIISSIYVLITIYIFAVKNEIPYLLLVAIVFETISLLPNKIKNVDAVIN